MKVVIDGKREPKQLDEFGPSEIFEYGGKAYMQIDVEVAEESSWVGVFGWEAG